MRRVIAPSTTYSYTTSALLTPLIGCAASRLLSIIATGLLFPIFSSTGRPDKKLLIIPGANAFGSVVSSIVSDEELAGSSVFTSTVGFSATGSSLLLHPTKDKIMALLSNTETRAFALLFIIIITSLLINKTSSYYIPKERINQYLQGLIV